ncbi:hypothetical protein FOA52_014953 [Chlamydomonas sp. UWO 241]|nr:hypothetical protein FOA52_014953 [Chlamydomonas sp. UWO 241]
MADAMHWGNLSPFEYHPHRGLYWHEVAPGLICGTQPRSRDDVSALHAEGVSHIISLQTDADLDHWKVSLHDLRHRCSELGVTHIRRMARDFDPNSLRKTLPSAVCSVHHALKEGRGRVYVHCTAGLGRAPAVCIAHMYWFGTGGLDASYKALTDVRPCGPKREAIRGATFDLLSGKQWDEFDRLGSDAWAGLSEEERYALQWRVLRIH